MPTIGKIRAILLGDTRQFESAMRRSGRRVDAFKRRLTGLRTGLIGVTGAVGFGGLIRQTVQEGELMGQLAKRLGTSVERFSRLARVLNRAGLETRTTATAIQRLQRRAADAAAGNDQLARAFRDVGINLKTFLQLDPVEAFVRLGERLARVENNARRIQLAFRLLDSEGVAILQANLPGLREEMARMTPVTTEQAKAMEELAASWTKLGEVTRSFAAETYIAGAKTGFTIRKGLMALGELVGRATGLVKPPYVRNPALLSEPGPSLQTIGGGGGRIGLTNVTTPALIPGNTITGGNLGPSNAILEELRGIRRNTQGGAVLE